MVFTKSRAASLRQCRRFLPLVLPMMLVASLSAEWPELLPLQLNVGQMQSTGSYIGIKLEDLDADRAKTLKLSEVSGVLVTAVLNGAAADQAGIHPGDVILSYNGEKILGAQQFIRLVAETPQGRNVRMACWRDGAQKNLSVTTGAPRAAIYPEDFDLSRMQITDVPAPVMLWRNLLLGLESESLNDQLAQFFGVKQGILIWSVAPTLPAQRAGLRAGDVVTGFCGRSIHSPRELGLVLQQLQSGQKPISVDLVRDHKAMSVSISLDAGR